MSNTKFRLCIERLLKMTYRRKVLRWRCSEYSIICKHLTNRLVSIACLNGIGIYITSCRDHRVEEVFRVEVTWLFSGQEFNRVLQDKLE